MGRHSRPRRVSKPEKNLVMVPAPPPRLRRHGLPRAAKTTAGASVFSSLRQRRRWPVAAPAATAEQVLWGYGVRGCDDYIAAAKAADAGDAAELGRFISGLNLALGEDVLRGSGLGTAMTAARDYCSPACVEGPLPTRQHRDRPVAAHLAVRARRPSRNGNVTCIFPRSLGSAMAGWFWGRRRRRPTGRAHPKRYRYRYRYRNRTERQPIPIPISISISTRLAGPARRLDSSAKILRPTRADGGGRRAEGGGPRAEEDSVGPRPSALSPATAVRRGI